MKVVFIAAGIGARLANITKGLPKPLVDINGKSLIERQISLLKKNEIDDILVITGPHHEKFTIPEIDYVNDPKYTEHDQVGSLMAARTKIYGDVLILFADILFDTTILKQVLASRGDIVIAVDLSWKEYYKKRNDNSFSEADKVAMKNDKIVRIYKDEKKLNEENTSIGEFLGIMKLTKIGSRILIEKFEELEKHHNGGFHDAASFKKAKIIDLLQELIQSNIHIVPSIIQGKWCEIDTPNDLVLAKQLFK